MLSGSVLPPAAVHEAALAHKKGPGGRKRSRQGEHFRTAEPVHPGTLSVDGNREWPAAMGIRVSYKLPPGVPPGLIDDASYLRRTSTALKRTGAASRVYFCDRVWILHHDNGTTTRTKSRSAAAAFLASHGHHFVDVVDVKPGSADLASPLPLESLQETQHKRLRPSPGHSQQLEEKFLVCGLEIFRRIQPNSFCSKCKQSMCPVTLNKQQFC